MECLRRGASRATFSYFTKTVSLAYHSPDPLVLGDTAPLEETESVSQLRRRFEEHKSTDHSLAWTLLRLGRSELLRAAIFEAIHIAASLCFPLLLRAQLDDLSAEGNQGWIWALLGVAVTLLSVIANQKHIDIAFRVGIRLKALCSVLVFDTALHRRHAIFDARGDTTGTVLNYISSDASKLQELCPIANLLWAAPLQILISTILISVLIGPAGLIGVLFLGVAMPALNAFMMVKVGAYRKEKMRVSDERVKLCSEMLAGIRVVKYLSWEVRFTERIMDVRLEEMRWVSRELHLFATYVVILISFPMLSMLVCFLSYIWINPEVPLTPGNAFATLSLFNVLRFPLMQMGTVLSAAAQAKVAVRRIENFISEDEAENANANNGGPTGIEASSYKSGETGPTVNTSGVKLVEGDASTVVIGLRDAEFSWSSKTQAKFILGPVTTDFECGECIAVVGAVGSGKSMLVASLLGETTLKSGSISHRHQAVSYVPQVAWIVNATVRENIIGFADSRTHDDAPFDKSLYNRVIAACSLARDIADMPNGDLQIIGERGVTLSGGQKQRIALARSAYTILFRQSKLGKDEKFRGIVLLDDPLSALDAHTARHVFDELLGPSGLLKGIARVLVTHAVQFLSQCNRVLMVQDGSVLDLGAFSNIERFLINNNEEEAKLDPKEAALMLAVRRLSTAMQETGSRGNGDDEQIGTGARSKSLSTCSADSGNGFLNKSENSTDSLMTRETLGKGTINFDVVRYFFGTMGGCLCFFVPLFFFFVLERTTYVGTDWWLSVWTDAANATPKHAFEAIGLKLPAAPHAAGQRFYASWYAVLVLVAAAFVVMRLHLFAHGYVRTSRIFFKRLVAASVRAPMSFFETTPLGRITNRYSYDTEVIDAQLFQRTNGVVASTSWLLGGVGVIIGSIPWMLLVLAPVFLLYFNLYRFYRQACVELQRLAAITRSPIQSTFQETLNGADSIRAFNVETAYSKKNSALLDDHSRASIALHVASRWLSVRLETLGVMVVAGASLLSYFIPGLSAGIAGLAIMWASQLSISLQFNTINLTEAESLLTSAERVLEYINLQQEPPHETAMEFKPHENWPSKGEIRFEEAVLSYRDDLSPALTGLSVTIEAGKKVGIVGRTGAGKSTIATALFRLRELTSGKILVDGVDVAKLGLRDVRGRPNGLAIITQDPLVFSGPIRFTLDPFNQHSDKEIWKALHAVQMRKAIIELWNNRGGTRVDVAAEDDPDALRPALSLPISEAGRNLSVGQRQLLCFARALLLQPQIIILDEATASVDYATDHIIQTTLRKNFPGVTMLVIAHRLATIIDLDAVLVMDNGKCVEYDTAINLLNSETTMFSSLVNATGSDASKKLRQMAMSANDSGEKGIEGEAL
eukprot:g4980.t1